jgi:hypothetical protein
LWRLRGPDRCHNEQNTQELDDIQRIVVNLQGRSPDLNNPRYPPRAPMACCFSNFKQLFANGQEFTYSIDDIALYYRTYLDLMQH